MLRDMGVDLQAYGELEEQAWQEIGARHISWNQHGPEDWPSYLHSPPLDPTVRKLGKLHYGPTVRDWWVEWDLQVEEYMEEFWALVESPRLQIPGAWVDDD